MGLRQWAYRMKLFFVRMWNEYTLSSAVHPANLLPHGTRLFKRYVHSLVTDLHQFPVI
jgi:hypothetical protein